MLTASTKGVYLIAATPFAEDGALDLAGLDQLVDWYLARDQRLDHPGSAR
jgi:4-hydroxy-tetrahydrodipicolinate synthase